MDKARPVPANTPARWEAARIRAITEQITVEQEPISGAFAAISSDGSRRYAVSWYSCSCPAGAAGDPVCKHRAAFRLHCKAEDRAVERLLAAQRREAEAARDFAAAPVEPAWVAELFDADRDELAPLEPVDAAAVEVAAVLTLPEPVAVCEHCHGTGAACFFGIWGECVCSIRERNERLAEVLRPALVEAA